MPEIVHMNADEPEPPVWVDSAPFKIPPMSIQPGAWLVSFGFRWDHATYQWVPLEYSKCVEPDAVIQCPKS
jgi:hypothetical protein